MRPQALGTTFAAAALAAALVGCGNKTPAPNSPPVKAPPAGGGAQPGAPAKAGIGGSAPAGTVSAETAAKVKAGVERAHTYLLKLQGPDGAWGVPGRGGDPGITAMVCTALLQTNPGATEQTHPAIWKALKSLQSYQKPDGAIFNNGNQNYVTSVSIMAMLASRDPAFRETAQKAAQYVAGGILDTGKPNPRKPSNPYYGGAGYGSLDPAEPDEPPHADNSNTTYALEALMRARDAGLKFDGKAFEAAVTFLQRTQHRTESNDQGWASDNPKVAGGFIYTPKESKAGMVTIDGKQVPMPYGTMTYAGIKSFIYARVDRNDPRVKAAVDWIRKFYTLEQNPGFDVSRDLKLGQQGLYYYFDTYAKAHAAIGEEQFADANGATHKWREELAGVLLAKQKDDGSWVNPVDRWMESMPVLATSYALMALSHCLPAP